MEVILEQSLRSFFSRKNGIAAVFLFGSHAKGKPTSTSDVDVAVLFQEGHLPDFHSQLELKQELAKSLKTNVDLIVMNRANPILKHQIFKNGRKFLGNDRSQVNRFFVKSLLEYDDVKRVRAPIEKSILKGRVYG